MNSSTRLWYTASANNWNEALPMGNGRMAAMVYCGEEIDRIQLNDDTFWSGLPSAHEEANKEEVLKEIRTLLEQGNNVEASQKVETELLGHWNQSYMSLGELQVNRYDTAGDKDDYIREINLEDATVRSSYSVKGVGFNNEYFTSHKDDLMAIRYTCDTKKINLRIGFDALHKESTSFHGNKMIIAGVAPKHIEPEYAPILPGIDYDGGMTYNLHIVVDTDGDLKPQGESFKLLNASYVTMYLTSATSFNGYDKNPITEGRNPEQICEDTLAKIADLSYEELLQRHIEDYSSLFNRASFQLDAPGFDHLPTDVRIKNYKAGDTKDKHLFKLLFDFGRYMLISGSRQGCQPLTLQGKWNKDVRPYWSSNLTVNINVQMNYWASEVCNLTECHEPLFMLLEELQQTGQATAKSYGCRGFASHHNLDIWRNTNATGIKNPKPNKARHAFWPFSGVWLCRHIWEHYMHTLDVDFLKKYYPILKDAVLFTTDWLYEDEKGTLISAPSTSPENQFYYGEDRKLCSVSQTSTMDLAMISDLWQYTIEAAKVLDIDSELVTDLGKKLTQLPEYQIGSLGQLQEWIEDFEEFEPGHRHQSHLYALYPGSDITPYDTPELAEACKTSIKRRLTHGGGYTGWSCAWIINLYARLLDIKGTESTLDMMMMNSIYTNMMDAHPPMQADGNYGALAGITEALLQSHNGFIHLLPALPASWEKGSVDGFISRGGFEIDMAWENAKLKEAKILSKEGSLCKIYVKDYSSFTLASMEGAISYKHEGDHITFTTKKNTTYMLTIA